MGPSLRTIIKTHESRALPDRIICHDELRAEGWDPVVPFATEEPMMTLANLFLQAGTDPNSFQTFYERAPPQQHTPATHGEKG